MIPPISEPSFDSFLLSLRSVGRRIFPSPLLPAMGRGVVDLLPTCPSSAGGACRFAGISMLLYNHAFPNMELTFWGLGRPPPRSGHNASHTLRLAPLCGSSVPSSFETFLIQLADTSLRRLYAKLVAFGVVELNPGMIGCLGHVLLVCLWVVSLPPQVRPCPRLPDGLTYAWAGVGWSSYLHTAFRTKIPTRRGGSRLFFSPFYPLR